MSGRRKAPSPADALRQFIYGDAPLDEWVAQGDDNPSEPWSSFERARRLAHAGQPDEAAKIWQQIARTERLESRQTLQAWHFLRQAGYLPAPDRAQVVLGVVAEMPVRREHDLLSAGRQHESAIPARRKRARWGTLPSCCPLRMLFRLR
jgi:hypothetical protein